MEEYTPGDKMRPKKNSSTIYLPVTLEANVGRSSNRFSMLFGAGAGTVLWVLFACGYGHSYDCGAFRVFARV